MTARCLPSSLALLLALFAPTAEAAEGSATETGLPRISSFLPAWLEVALDHRSRFEARGDAVDPEDASEDVLGYVLRTRLLAALAFSPVRIAIELLDSRAALTSESQERDLTIVNPLDVLSAFVELELEGVLAPEDRTTVRAGRQTLNLGSRRLVARNRFRNTINAFTGGLLRYHRPELLTGSVFFYFPVERRIAGVPNLDGDRESYFDVETFHLWFTGAYLELHPASWPVEIEVYAFGLDDRRERFDRRLFTPGLRFVRAPAPARIDFELEGAVQLGESRDPFVGRPLPHRAGFAHLDVGYTVDVALPLRLELGLDVASGEAPNLERTSDTVTGFDTLYGARRSDFGPTSLLGRLGREDILSPFVRAEWQPHPALSLAGMFRPVWAPSSGTYRGPFGELSLSYSPWRPGLDLEGGLALTELEDLTEPSRPVAVRSTYAYLQLALRL